MYTNAGKKQESCAVLPSRNCQSGALLKVVFDGGLAQMSKIKVTSGGLETAGIDGQVRHWAVCAGCGHIEEVGAPRGSSLCDSCEDEIPNVPFNPMREYGVPRHAW